MAADRGYTVFEDGLREVGLGEDELAGSWESFEDELGPYEHAGYESGPYEAAGYEHAGYEHAGYEHAGYESGPYESGPYESGPYETGPYGAAGYEHAGYESGLYETAGSDEGGPYEFGAYESGPYETPGYESGPYETAGYESVSSPAFEDESAEGVAWESTWESTYEDEADQFLPLIGLAASALPSLVKAAAPLVRRLLPVARRAVGSVVRSVANRPPARPPVPRPPGPVGLPVQRAPGPALPRRRQETVSMLLRRLARVLGEGESLASQAEASLFGSAESQFELGAGAASQEAALTEVLAAEAAHTESLPEAQAMLGAALPITIRIMGARRMCGPYLPALTSANGRLVRTLATRGRDERQLLRVVPTIQRRAVASVLRAGQSGRPLTPRAVDQIVAGQAARVLSSPRLVGPALLRNHAVRLRTVAPAGRRPASR